MNEIINEKEINNFDLKIIETTYSQQKHITISFNNQALGAINNFFVSNNIIDDKDKKHYFISNNYSIEIDLLENYQNGIGIDIYIWFINCVQEANNIICSNSNKYFKLFGSNINLWNITICKNIMFNLPFTLDNIIFIPLDYIESEYEISKANKTDKSTKMINTLIHEKIHIAQRYNEKIWEKFITDNNYKNNGWIKVFPNLNPEFDIIDKNLKYNKSILKDNERFISNPDTSYSGFKYIWYEDDKKYFGTYICNVKTNKIKKKFFEIDLNKNIFSPTNFYIEEEHPYEIYAYKIANELVK